VDGEAARCHGRGRGNVKNTNDREWGGGGGGTYFPQLLGAENGGLTLEERFVGRATRVFPSRYPSLNK
jgi:hypothetical protein